MPERESEREGKRERERGEREGEREREPAAARQWGVDRRWCCGTAYQPYSLISLLWSKIRISSVLDAS